GRGRAAEGSAEDDDVVTIHVGDASTGPRPPRPAEAPPRLLACAARMADTLHHLLAVWMQFVLDWGYIGIFLMMMFESTAVPIPAEVVIPPAAFWASQGKLNIFGVVAAATAGSWVGSALSYWIAYKLGRP